MPMANCTCIKEESQTALKIKQKVVDREKGRESFRLEHTHTKVQTVAFSFLILCLKCACLCFKVTAGEASQRWGGILQPIFLINFSGMELN